MRRRDFLRVSAAAGAGLGAGVGLMAAAGARVQGLWENDPFLGPVVASAAGSLRRPTLSVRHPGKEMGHQLRAAWMQGDPWKQVLPGTPTRRVHALVAGSGAAGLACAHRLQKTGQRDYLLLSGPAPQGNLASGVGQFGLYPQGAHYLPLPSQRSTHMRQLLQELNVIKEGAHHEAPLYDPAAVVHAPAERVFKDGKWHDGLLPPLDEAGQAQWARLQKMFLGLRAGQDKGVAVFGTPLHLTNFKAANARQTLELDQVGFGAWLRAQGIDHPDLLWFFDYCCLDEYGLAAEHISAWAGLHYFCSEHGKAQHAQDGAVLTWPRGLGELAHRMDMGLPAENKLRASVLAARPVAKGWEVLCLDEAAKPFVVNCAHLVLAMPLFVARRLVPEVFEDLGRASGPVMTPWVVANFQMKRFPHEAPGPELAWDSVVCGSTSLGFVNSTHQLTRQAKPEATVFSAYCPLSSMLSAEELAAFEKDEAGRPGRPGSPNVSGAGKLVRQARTWAERSGAEALLEKCSQDLNEVYGPGWMRDCAAVEFTVHGHAMAAPVPGFLREPLAQRAREVSTSPGSRLHFAHADLSGYSVFEEAAFWGDAAARRLT